jgi:cobalt-precorrin 5A hydrolase
MAGEQAMIVAGLGFRRGTSAEELERVVRLALDSFEVSADRLQAIATAAGKAAEPSLPELARRLSAPIVGCSLGELAGMAGRIPTPSRRVLKVKGVPSIAEAAALVAAGRNGRLLGKRIATPQATCAIAIGDGT